MKKFYLLCILFTSMMQAQVDIKNFKVTSPTNESFTWNDGQRFNYKFDIRGNYGYNEIKLWAYAESVTSNNLIGLIRWNREGDDNLSFSSYTTKPMWVSVAHRWNGRNFTTNSGKKFYLVVEYQGSSQTFLYTIPYRDFDNDGIPDIYDNCQFVFNPSQSDIDNNGIGDACEQPDSDRDGINDFRDNCPWVYNPFQIDSDGDGIGNACDFNRSGGDLTMSKNLGASHTVEIYTIDGSLFTRQKVDNTQKEKDLINSLPKGFYIIKNGDKTYKIVK